MKSIIGTSLDKVYSFKWKIKFSVLKSIGSQHSLNSNTLSEPSHNWKWSIMVYGSVHQNKTKWFLNVDHPASSQTFRWLKESDLNTFMILDHEPQYLRYFYYLLTPTCLIMSVPWVHSWAGYMPWILWHGH